MPRRGQHLGADGTWGEQVGAFDRGTALDLADELAGDVAVGGVLATAFVTYGHRHVGNIDSAKENHCGA